MSDKAVGTRINRLDRLNRWLGFFAALFFAGGIFLHSHYKAGFALNATLLIAILVLALAAVFYALALIDTISGSDGNP
jgi:hypothetical protein